MCVVKRLMILWILFCAGVAMADAPPEKIDLHSYVKAEIYFLGWDTSTLVPMTVESVMQSRNVYLEVSDRWLVEMFLQWLDIDEMQENFSGKVSTNPRLVIRLTREDGTTEIFSAGPFRRWKDAPPGKGNFLYSQDSRRRKELSVDEMEYFEGLMQFMYDRNK